MAKFFNPLPDPNLLTADIAAPVKLWGLDFDAAIIEPGAGDCFTKYLSPSLTASFNNASVGANKEIGFVKNPVGLRNMVSVGLFAEPPNAPPI